ELIETSWEESNLFQYLDSTKFLLIIYKITDDDAIFKGVKFWNMPYQDLHGSVKETWEKTISTLKEGITLTYKPLGKKSNTGKAYRISNNLPKVSDDTILHVRPDARVSSYTNDSNSLKL